MNFHINSVKGQDIAISDSKENMIKDIQQALEILMNFIYQDIDKLVIYEENLLPEFYDLKSGIAGEMLQKFSNYGGYLAIVGDFEKYQSNSFQAFIKESNRQGRVVFVETLDQALIRFS